MAKDIISVGGMSCEHCVATITNSEGTLKGVHNVSVNLEDKNVAVDYEGSITSLEIISASIIAAGFEVV